MIVNGQLGAFAQSSLQKEYNFFKLYTYYETIKF